MEVVDNWHLPKGAIVKNSETQTIKFHGMDCMCGKWEILEGKGKGEMSLARFDALKNMGDYWVPCEAPEESHEEGNAIQDSLEASEDVELDEALDPINEDLTCEEKCDISNMQ